LLSVELPEGASLGRTDAALTQAQDIVRQIPGV